MPRSDSQDTHTACICEDSDARDKKGVKHSFILVSSVQSQRTPLSRASFHLRNVAVADNFLGILARHRRYDGEISFPRILESLCRR